MHIYQINPEEGKFELRSSFEIDYSIIVGEYTKFFIATSQNKSDTSFILFDMNGNITGFITWVPAVPKVIKNCRNIKMYFEHIGFRLAAYIVCFQSTQNVGPVCAVYQRWSDGNLNLRLKIAMSTTKAGHRVVSDRTYLQCPFKLSRSSKLIFKTGSSFADIITLTLSSANDIPVNYILVDNVNHRFIFVLPQNKILNIDWFHLRGTMVYNVTDEDILEFASSSSFCGFFVLRNGDLVQYDTSISESAGHRNLTLFKIYRKTVECGEKSLS
jgi:hypothetical protein